MGRVSYADLRSCFRRFGEIRRVEMGRNKNYAFVEFCRFYSAVMATEEMSWKWIRKLCIRVEMAKPIVKSKVLLPFSL